MHRRPLVRVLVALLVLLGGAVQGAAVATMPFFCCGGLSTDMHGGPGREDIPSDDATTMQAGDDCGVTCGACAVCHSTAVVSPPLAQASNIPSLRFVGANAYLLPLALEPFHRPPRASRSQHVVDR